MRHSPDLSPAEAAKLTEDVLSILIQSNGREAVSYLLTGLRGGIRCAAWPESGRRWRNLDTFGSFEPLLEELGFTLTPVYAAGSCCVRATYVSLD